MLSPSWCVEEGRKTARMRKLMKRLTERLAALTNYIYLYNNNKKKDKKKSSDAGEALCIFLITGDKGSTSVKKDKE